MKKKIFLVTAVVFVLMMMVAVPAFAETATLYNTNGELCNLWGGRVSSAKEATFNGTIYENGGKKFFSNNNGTDPTNVWVHVGDVWHYAGSDCYFVKDQWVKFASKNYYFDTNGNLVSVSSGPGNPVSTLGWKKLSNGKWRYYTKSTTYVTGWQKLKWSKGTDWFYFDKNGYMLENTWTPDGYWVDANGAWDGHDYRCINCGKRPSFK